MSDTVFSKIIAGEIPADFVYQDETCIVIKDINPTAKTHLLIIPRKAIISIMHMEDSDEKIIGHLFQVAKKIAAQKQLAGYKLHINVGKEGGQEIPHLHIHLLSKFA